ncbi:FAD-dependent oxidoreductase [Sphingomonas bacterium]|uniref:FAD-dependent oxidoreductase n=1 Tax=Sphingomonas bacterium TaxID=1895847 RepID=UPI00157524FF|nr:FAD-dependent oxidoreductase [Sphingomonas bacterium]
MDQNFDTDVLVVGAGPVGLSLALELGLRGDAVTLIERDDTRGPQPRAKTLNMRSLEHLRRWGIADAIRAASPITPDLPTDIVFQTRLYGHHIATLPNIYFRGNERADDSRFSEPSEWIPQYLVERVMKARVEAIPSVTLRYGTELVGFTQDGGSVTAELRTTAGESLTVRARYLVGADGARSRVREAIGATMTGRHAYGANYNMVLDIPELNADPPSPRGIMHWTLNADSPGILGPIGDLWYAAKKLPEGVSGMGDDEIHSFITGTIGRDVAFRLVAVDPWYAHELIADRYRRDRVFLAGDACHLHPPFGGYGMNMGIADAVDLGWKLDAVLHGWAGDALLNSYEWERRRVHQWTIDESVANYAVLSANMVRPDMEADTSAGEAARAALAPHVVEQKRREFHTIGMVLGYHYSGSPVIAGDGALPPPSAEEYEPLAVPGALAPHLWLAPGVSLYDRFGTGFTLLDRSGGGAGVAAFRDAADRLGVPLTVLALDGEHVATLYPDALTLVRPDEHVAWTGDGADPEAAIAALRRVTAR